MRVAVTGATGTIGSTVVRALLARGDQVAVLSRSAERARSVLGPDVEVYEWRDPQHVPPPAAALERTSAVIHSLGEPIAQRWTEKAKREIRDSRVLGTRMLISGLAALAAGRRPRTLVSQSASGYYGARGDERLDEQSASGEDFLARITVAWEQEAGAAPSGTRIICARTGVVLSARGGALAKMLPPFKLGVGGPVGGGRQYVPWIHVDDVAGALVHCVHDERATGAVNVTAPEPVTNAELSNALGRVLHRPAVLPVPATALRLMYGEMASVVLSGQRAVPRRLIELGYDFKHPQLEAALRDVVGR